MTIPPMLFDWTEDEVLEPRHPALAQKHFVIGETYRLAPVEARSQAAHNKFFAVLTEKYDSMPERIVERFPTLEHFRKYCLILAGFREQRTHVCESKREARRMAAFIEPIDPFAVVDRDGRVTVYTAESQSRAAMGAKKFYDSWEAIDRICDRLLLPEPQLMRREFTRAIKAAAWKRAAGRCEECTAELSSGNVHYDHTIADAMGGEPILKNCSVLCRNCHGAKTAQADVPAIARAKRKEAVDIGAKVRKHRWGYGRGDRWKKTIGGKVVRR